MRHLDPQKKPVIWVGQVPPVGFPMQGHHRHDHQLKTGGRWRLSQPEPGHFTWIAPLAGGITPDPRPSLMTFLIPYLDFRNSTTTPH